MILFLHIYFSTFIALHHVTRYFQINVCRLSIISEMTEPDDLDMSEVDMTFNNNGISVSSDGEGSVKILKVFYL